MALSLFIGAKWITILRLKPSKRRVAPARLFAYALLWPGLDAQAFCTKRAAQMPLACEWSVAVTMTLFGVVLLWPATRVIGLTHALAAGWVGMIGTVCLLHFGMLHLLSLIWRAMGISAKPIMQSPLAVTSLSKFWGGGWNTAFSDMMNEQFLKALLKSFGARRALLIIFLISGILHELVISLPAGGGYGLPTVYFLNQGFGVLMERSGFGRRVGLGSSWKGRCFVALVAGLPAFLLFPPVFVHNVILPMLQAIGATERIS